MLLSEKTAVQDLIVKQKLIGLAGIRSPINETILDCKQPLEDFQQYFTIYAWAAVKKEGSV